ncbi:acyl-CoA thioesterase [Neobacillus muris]|uniref:acyl-CoA thioesterase n=1 Tax=Neobacillus muris TaxID=2941334 RepID=UPI0020400305|nr:acyl-CoA thioesterase [Neobacillus muris]
MAYTEWKTVAKTDRGHVSNVKLFEYFDEARKEWYRFCTSLEVQAVVVHIEVDYRREIWNNEKLTITTSLEQIGNTSFILMQKMENGQNELAAAAEVVLTTINTKTREKTRVPNALRSFLNQKDQLNVLAAR